MGGVSFFIIWVVFVYEICISIVYDLRYFQSTRKGGTYIMRGKMTDQIDALWKLSGIDGVGESKHNEKIAARELGAKGFEDVGKHTTIHSYSARDNNLSTWKDLAKFCHKNFGVKDIEKIKPEHITAWVEHKMNQGLEKGTIENYISRVEKFEMAINLYKERREIDPKFKSKDSRTKALEKIREAYREANQIKNDKKMDYRENLNLSLNYSKTLEECRQKVANGFEKTGEMVNRRYIDIPKIISNLRNEKYRTGAEVQAYGGARISEIAKLSRENMIAPGQILLTNTKGKKIRTTEVPMSTWNKVMAEIEKNGSWTLSDRGYNKALRNSIERAGEVWNGNHGMRWAYSVLEYERQMRIAEEEIEQGKTKSRHRCLKAVSQKMGHERGEITRRYQGGYAKYARK